MIVQAGFDNLKFVVSLMLISNDPKYHQNCSHWMDSADLVILGVAEVANCCLPVVGSSDIHYADLCFELHLD